MKYKKIQYSFFLKPKLIYTLIVYLSTYNLSFSQIQDSITLKEIDSLLKSSLKDLSSSSYTNYRIALKKSKEIGNKSTELQAYSKLMNYFSYQKNLDSMMHYAHNFEKGGYENQTKNMISIFFYEKGSNLIVDFEMIEQSLVELKKAYEYVDTSNTKIVVSIKNALAYTYMAKKQYQKAIDILESFSKDSISINSSVELHILINLGQAYQKLLKPKKSYAIHLKALNIAKTLKDTASLLFVKSNMINDYYLQGRFQKAVDSGLHIVEKLKKHRPDGLQGNAYFLSRAYDTIGNIDKSIYYMKEAIAAKDGYYPEMSDYNQIEALTFLARSYEKKKDYKNAAFSLWKKNKIIENIRSKEQKAFTDYYDTKIKIIDQQRKQEKIEIEKEILSLQNNKQQQYIIILSVGLVCLLLIITSIWIYLKYFKSKEKIKELKNNEREILRNHIEVRETELSMLANNKAKLLSELSEIKKELSIAIKENNAAQVQKVEKKLNSFLMQTANDDVFSERLESQYPGMVIILKNKHPELSQNDIKHCILIKLGLSLKESAQLMHVGIGAIKMGRNRAKSKMNLTEELSLKQYLDQINTEPELVHKNKS
ncbi:lipopolysaccharide assembly protein LapB [Aquimarina sp. RZ0]|uniref:tetratricopeptide repeat protein n=1 Tax=Aquimarina sp. RZ0 TaxID=2607730 RepID=UPI0011F263B7|nr:hypothetical protein [Aquimarina sp. RZ0]KAA1244268.1 hypothetical protein F0000_17250 [Aquimarina sp. RZ0]